MAVCLATGWPPDVVRGLTLAELTAWTDLSAERDRARRRAVSRSRGPNRGR